MNTADINTPLYYVLTGFPARLISSLGLVRDFASAGRILGGIWLGLGLVLLWILAREAGSSLGSRLGVVAFVGTAPGVLYMFSIVNPDATTLVAGGLVLLAAQRWESGHWPLLVLVVAGVVAVMLKSTNMLAVLATATYLILHRPDATRTESTGASSGYLSTLVSRARFQAVALLLLAIGGAEAAWLVTRRLLAGNHPPFIPMKQALYAKDLRLGKVMDQATAMVFPTNWVPPLIKPIPLTWDFQLLGVLMVGATAGAILFAERRGYLSSLGAGAWTMLVVGGPLIVILTFYSEHAFVEIPARYGFSLIPFFAVGTAAAVRGRPLTAVLLALAAVATATDVGHLTHLMTAA